MSIADSPVRRVSVSARVIQFLPSSSFAAFLNDREGEAKEERKHTSERELCFYVCCQKRFMINLSEVSTSRNFLSGSFWQLYTEPKGESMENMFAAAERKVKAVRGEGREARRQESISVSM